MSTWEIIKKLSADAGIFSRQALLLLLIGFLGIFGYYIAINFTPATASLEYENIPYEAMLGGKEIDIELKDNGVVLLDGEKINNTLHFYKDKDEFRLKVIDENQSNFYPYFKTSIKLPKPVGESDVRVIVYAVHGVGMNYGSLTDPQTITYEAQNISPGATLTIVAELPKGLIKPGFFQSIEYYLSQIPIGIWLYVGIIVPAIILILMLVMIIRRRRANYMSIRGLLGGPPENIAPAIPGVLVDGVVGAREIAATLIDLAKRGYIYIINKGNGEFTFGVRKTGDFHQMTELSDFEIELLDKIFMPKAYKSSVKDVEMRIGKHIFSRKIANFYLGIYNEATKQGFFVENPSKVHLSWKYTGIVFFYISFLGFMIGATSGLEPKYSLLFWVGGIIASLVMVRLSPFMPARTQKGNEELRAWLEFREYLINRKPASSVDMMQNKFEDYLPYAIVLGAEVEWVKRFESTRFSKPDWYESREPNVTLGSFAAQLFPLIGFVASHLARSHDPSVE